MIRRGVILSACLPGLLLTACAGPDDGPAGNSIALANLSAGTASIEVMLERRGRGAALVEDAARAIVQIGHELADGSIGADGPVDVVNITIATHDGKLLHLSYDAQELRQTVHMTEDGDTALAAARDAGWWTPQNDDAIDAYCNAVPGSNFCGKFME